MNCKAKDNCDEKAEYEFQGIKTCYDCMYEHIQDNLLDTVIENYISMEARQLDANGE